MPERSALTQGVQVGVEATPGTSVAANKKLVSIGIDPGIEMEPSVFRPMGQKYPSVISPGKEWVEFDLEGVGNYSEVIYPLSSCLVAPGAPATVDGTGRTWAFAPASAAEDTVKTFTVEQGGVVRAHKFTHALVSELEFTFNRDGVEIGGSGFGQSLSDNITLTAAPTTPPEVPIMGKEIDVYMDTTSAGLGTTKLTRALEAVWTLGDRFNPLWVLNSANSSFVAAVESEPTGELELTVEADAQGMSILPIMRAGSTRFFRIKATSATLAGATTEPYSMSLDCAGKVNEPGDFTDEDGVYAIGWTMTFVHDATWGSALKASVTNKETAL